MGWQQADLDALQARRFNLIRIFLDWSILDIKDGAPTPQAARGFVQPDGSLTHTETLLALVRACAVRGIMVDVTILTSIYDAAVAYQAQGTPLIVIDGERIHGFDQARIEALLAKNG